MGLVNDKKFSHQTHAFLELLKQSADVIQITSFAAVRPLAVNLLYETAVFKILHSCIHSLFINPTFLCDKFS